MDDTTAGHCASVNHEEEEEKKKEVQNNACPKFPSSCSKCFHDRDNILTGYEHREPESQ